MQPKLFAWQNISVLYLVTKVTYTTIYYHKFASDQGYSHGKVLAYSEDKGSSHYKTLA